MTNKRIDIIIALILLLLILFVYTQSRTFPPRALYFVDRLNFFLLLLTGIYLFDSLLKLKQNVPEKTAEGLNESDTDYRRVIISLVCFALYVFVLIPLVGFLAATVLILFLIMYFLGIRSVSLLSGITVGLPLLLYLVFQVLLKIPLPVGLIFE